jgi:aminoglycoside phosphotransferase (APT) family kinase protein
MSEEKPLKGIERDRVGQWLAAALPQAAPPFTFQLIAAGGSNLTYRVEDARGSAFILRRPPVAGALPTAHDMSREWRIMRALGTHAPGVPVPAMLAFCDDVGVSGAPFYVMEFVDGLILRDRASAAGMDAAACRTAMRSLVATQAAFHTLDPAAAGLADLGRHEGYVARQLARWRRQVEASKTRDLPLLVELHERLSAGIPPETRRPGLAHGDYRFDNTVLAPDHRVRAVLDWELCTIGDPVADFFWSLMYWAEPGDAISFLPDPPTRLPQFPRRAEVVACYEEITGQALPHAQFYTAFGWWKQACIVEGVYGRLVNGASGGLKTAPPEQVARIVERYLECAVRALA